MSPQHVVSIVRTTGIVIGVKVNATLQWHAKLLERMGVSVSLCQSTRRVWGVLDSSSANAALGCSVACAVLASRRDRAEDNCAYSLSCEFADCARAVPARFLQRTARANCDKKFVGGTLTDDCASAGFEQLCSRLRRRSCSARLRLPSAGCLGHRRS